MQLASVRHVLAILCGILVRKHVSLVHSTTRARLDSSLIQLLRNAKQRLALMTTTTT